MAAQMDLGPCEQDSVDQTRRIERLEVARSMASSRSSSFSGLRRYVLAPIAMQIAWIDASSRPVIMITGSVNRDVFEALLQLEAIHAGHLDIEHQAIRLSLLEALKEIGRGFERFGLDPRSAQQSTERSPDRSIVIDHRHIGAAAAGFRSPVMDGTGFHG